MPITLHRHGLNPAKSILGALIVTGRDYPECTPLLCRPLFELSSRLLWESMRDGGFSALVIHWSSEDRKFANDARELGKALRITRLEEFTEIEDMEKSADQLIRATEYGQTSSAAIKHPTSLQQVLIDLHRDSKFPVFAKLQYVQVYRMMSNACHGSLSQVARTPEAWFTAATNTAVYSAYMLLKALVRVMVPEKPRKRSLGVFLNC